MPQIIPKLTRIQIGQAYENRALQLLAERGLKFIERNVFFKVGEIDLIFQEGRTLVFVEVRYRSREHSWEDPFESLGYGKMARLKRAIELYLQKNKMKLQALGVSEIRVDAMGFRDFESFSWIRGIELNG